MTVLDKSVQRDCISGRIQVCDSTRQVSSVTALVGGNSCVTVLDKSVQRDCISGRMQLLNSTR